MNNPTTEQKAVSVLVQVAKLAQSKGILSLEDANVVLQSVNYLESTCLKEEEQPIATAEPTKTDPKTQPKAKD
jgi:flagellar motor component MotA